MICAVLIYVFLMHTSSSKGDLEATRSLVKSQVNMDQADDSEGFTALHTVVRADYVMV